MAERVNTGGTVDFEYSKEDMDRIRNTDTDSTRDFKEGLKKHYSELEERRKRNKIFLEIMAILAVVIIIGIVVYWYLL